VSAAALIRAMWIIEILPRSTLQSSVGFAPQQGQVSESGLVGNTFGMEAFATLV